MNTQQFSDYIVYVDESGDHSLGNIDKEYPFFVLAFCVFKKTDYLQVIQQITALKFKYFGHDKVVLHESDIRRKRDDFNIFNKESQAEFMGDYWQIIENAKFTVISCVIDKLRYKEKYATPDNPYELSMRVCIGEFRDFLKDNGVDSSILNHIIVEKRGKNEDSDLELAFRRICEDKQYNIKLRMASKLTNCVGLQIADLIARPIGLNIMRPEQANRGFEIVAKKLRTDKSGNYKNYGLKVLP